MFFPLSSFEQSLLHKFALEPPSSLPPSSIPVLQDLVCVRLIQSGQYLEAVKLDQQFASTQLGRGVQVPQAAERRRKMIEDVVATLPSIERQEIEEKLRAAGQRKSGTQIKPVQIKAADLSMSWENIPPPSRVLPITSGPPRFVLGRPNYGQNQPKVVAAPAIEGIPVQPIRPLPQGIENAAPPGLNGASHIPTLPPPSSWTGSRVGLFGPPQTSKPLLNSGPGGHKPLPLFPSLASRDPHHSTGNQTVLNSQKATPYEEPRVQDSSSRRGVIAQIDAETMSDIEDQYDDPVQAPEPAPVAEFSESVFLSSRPEPSPYAREPTEPLLPGAFRGGHEAAQSEPNQFAHSPPTPPTQPRPIKSRRTARTSVPGGFHEDASGEEDNVPPLPEVSPVKRSTRRRASRTSSVDGDEDNALAKPRRSSRLSAASSSSDPSPQKTSAPKATRRTRGSAGSSAATGIASSTRSSTRKRR
jgi:hypothetical protein